MTDPNPSAEAPLPPVSGVALLETCSQKTCNAYCLCLLVLLQSLEQSKLFERGLLVAV